jgi:hypothetical protein
MAALSSALIAPAVYVALLKNRDKTGPMIASILCAGSIYYVHAANQTPISAMATLLIVCAYAFVNFDLTILAAVLLTGATVLRPDTAVFAIAILGCSIVQRQKLAVPATVIYAVLALAGLLACRELLPTEFHQLFQYRPLHFELPWLLKWAMTPPFLICWWFIFPFCGELTNPESRQKYLPVVLALIAYLSLMSIFVLPMSPQCLLPAIPFLYLVIGLGIARIIPTIAGDIPSIAFRYTVAIAAAASLIFVCYAQQWHMLKQSREMRTSVNLNAAPTAPAKVITVPQPILPVIPVAVHPPVHVSQTAVRKPASANSALIKVIKQGEVFNESRSNGGRGRNAAAPINVKPTKTVSTHSQQTVHAALNRAPKAVWSGRNYRYVVLSRGRNRRVFWRWVGARRQVNLHH